MNFALMCLATLSGRVRIRGRNQKHVPYSSCLLQLLFAYLDRSL